MFYLLYYKFLSCKRTKNLIFWLAESLLEFFGWKTRKIVTHSLAENY
jgi:hypothetical protein